LGEHDRLALVQWEFGEQLCGFDGAVGVGRGPCREVGDGIGAAAGAFAEVFEADVSADSEDPGHHGPTFPSLEVCHHPYQRFLGEVVGFSWAGEVGAEPPHVGLNRTDEPVECDPVAERCRGCEAVQIVHPDNSARRFGNFASC